MRPLRFLLSLCTSLVAITLLLYLAFGSQPEETLRNNSTQDKSRLKALFSFTSPGGLFPPSAIISLTDDNSTFFLARPAAFGPVLPSNGLSGPLWVGTGFGEDTLGSGELGCSDVPGWNDASKNIGLLGIKTASDAKVKPPGKLEHKTHLRPQQAQPAQSANSKSIPGDDGTDDYLHQSSPTSKLPRTRRGEQVERGDIKLLQEDAEIAGKVVLLKRGGCGFLEKVKWAQRRGGVAVIVGDDARGGSLVRMYAHGDTSNVTIPSLFTSHTTAHLLSSLLPTGGLIQHLSSEDAAKLNLIKSGKISKNAKSQAMPGKKQETGGKPTSTRREIKSTQPPKFQSGVPNAEEQPSSLEDTDWLHSFLSAFYSGKPVKPASKVENRRPPSSGKLDWVMVEDWDEEQRSVKPKSATTETRSTMPSGDFIIGEQDWRDKGLLSQPTSTKLPSSSQSSTPNNKIRGGSTQPSSGEYTQAKIERTGGWFSNLLGLKRDDLSEVDSTSSSGKSATFLTSAHHNGANEPPDVAGPHEGLWVTLTPTNMSTSPFFDTLLVLVVSPLVTLTVVYALLLLRSRIRRRRWRAPKSLVERLPVRTYHTISDSSPSATPGASSPTTPLLQRTPSRPNSSLGRPRSYTEPEIPATSSSFHQGHRTPEEEKRESGLAAWRRRYGGRQKECVVCLEEYEDGISRVMSLPCGHEFHADCITPWLVTRRRTCPICKGDVVRSLSQSYHDRTISALDARYHDELDDVQAEAAETRNDSPSASRPLPIASDSLDADIEANWTDEHDERGQEIPGGRSGELSSSFREVSSSVVTTIWRGFEAVGRATGLQRRPSREEVDRDR